MTPLAWSYVPVVTMCAGRYYSELDINVLLSEESKKPKGSTGANLATEIWSSL